ncbi:hypothetical protein [Pedobacter cryoconitis]|uniref:HK97 gp10 family phage protein n=1 Tax=Pedobacter cryoconitis TaxID=188932 RepID=A0A327SIC4_9SPHI|nr:hypothetical protein [Pedobacter cryoconitis]RAJ28870.1 hypothetical protein LY11_03144 [Pedobacter cryoconitis]
MITGLDKALSRLTTKFVRVENAILDGITSVGEAIKADASSYASAIGFFDNDGNWVELNGAIKGGATNKGQGYRIWVDAGKMGAYVEFGTGEYASGTLAAYNQEWRELARQFYVNGKGRLPARPYMYPAWVKNTTGLTDNLRKRMNNPY